MLQIELGLTSKLCHDLEEKLWKGLLQLFIDIYNSQNQERDVEKQVFKDEIIKKQQDIKVLGLKLQAKDKVIASFSSHNSILEKEVMLLKKEINNLKQNQKIFKRLITQKHPTISTEDQKSSLDLMNSLKDQLKQLSAAHIALEKEKSSQQQAIKSVELLLKENFAPTIDYKNIQVNEQELLYGMDSIRRPGYMDPEFTHLEDRTSCIALNDVTYSIYDVKFQLTKPQNEELIDLPQNFFKSKGTNKGQQASKNDNLGTSEQLEGDSNIMKSEGQIETLKNLDLQKVDSNKDINTQRKVQISTIQELKDDDKTERKEKIKKGKGKKRTMAAIKHSENPVIWQLPYGLCNFLNEIAKDYKEISVVAWPIFKKQIYSLYISRIEDDSEISGYILNSFISFEEYIAIYYTQKNEHRRLAELKTLEFLSSLKYFGEKFPRAYLCALMCNIIETKPFGKFTIFLQNYFLYIFSQLIQFQDQFIDEEEGSSLIPLDKISSLIKKLLNFYSSDKKRDFVLFLKNKVSKKGSKCLIDVDMVMLLLVREYLSVS